MKNWALILGGSSGMGLATAKKLSSDGLNIILVHRDRKSVVTKLQEDFDWIRNQGVQLMTLNGNALADRENMLQLISNEIGDGKISVLLHSIAFGNLKLIAPEKDREDSSPFSETLCDEEDFEHTIYSMGTSLLFWVQDVFKKGLFAEDARVFGLTSEGNQVAWKGYSPVSAAKSALESISRSIAVEYAPYGIRCNILQPGVTDTPALRLIPGNESLKSHAINRNPFSRLTTPEDVANVIGLLSKKDAAWINGSIIRVDGGENIGG